MKAEKKKKGSEFAQQDSDSLTVGTRRFNGMDCRERTEASQSEDEDGFISRQDEEEREFAIKWDPFRDKHSERLLECFVLLICHNFKQFSHSNLFQSTINRQRRWVHCLANHSQNNLGKRKNISSGLDKQNPPPTREDKCKSMFSGWRSVLFIFSGN